MSKGDVIPELKQILGAMIIAADGSLSIKEMHRCLVEVAEAQGEETAAFARVRENDIRAALDELKADLEKLRSGFFLMEVVGGFRLQSDAACGKWLRHLLNTGRPSRLSRPALETLSIIAYRQPVARSEIEAVRGVNVDHVIKTLMEMQLVRIVGRSDLPGRPFLYGTTQTFLEHFGLRDLNELSDVEPTLLAKRATEVRGQKSEVGLSAETLAKEEDQRSEVGGETMDDATLRSPAAAGRSTSGQRTMDEGQE